MDYESIGQRVRAGRRAMKWTQEQFAEHLGLSFSYIGHIERGSRNASIETLSAICDALHLSMDDLLGRDPMSEKTREDFARELLAHALRLVDQWLASNEARSIRRQSEP